MALLSTAIHRRIWAALMRRMSDAREGAAFSKAELLAAVEATDAWIDGAAASYNAALPAPVRTGATAAQKTILFCVVAMRRAGLSLPNEDPE